VDQAELDRRLQRFTGAERRIAANLVELEEHPTYRLLAAGDMGGLTGRRMNGPMEAAPALWSWLGVLHEVLGRCRDLQQAARGRFAGEERARLEQMLTGASVTLTTTSGSLGERDLLTPDVVEHQITIEQLIDRMRNAYEPIRDGVAAVDEVWRDMLPRMDAAETSIDEAAATVTRLGLRVPAVDRARQRLDAVRSTVADDPLSLAERVGPELDRLVAEAVHEVGRHEQSHSNLDVDLATVASLVAELRLLRARAAAAYSEAHAKVRPESELVRVPSPAIIDGPNGLAERAGYFHDPDLDWQAVRTQLDDWMQMAVRLRDQLIRAGERNRAPLELRDELRGRFKAYKVKLEATQRTDEPEIQELVDELQNELYTRPTDVTVVESQMERLALVLAE
jgi:hypothetical protein